MCIDVLNDHQFCLRQSRDCIGRLHWHHIKLRTTNFKHKFTFDSESRSDHVATSVCLLPVESSSPNANFAIVGGVLPIVVFMFMVGTGRYVVLRVVVKLTLVFTSCTTSSGSSEQELDRSRSTAAAAFPLREDKYRAE